tara:strand:+ start:250 stop:627 length:378 start_codon:yes stop_codon:yes gene_type:complete
MKNIQFVLIVLAMLGCESPDYHEPRVLADPQPSEEQELELYSDGETEHARCELPYSYLPETCDEHFGVFPYQRSARKWELKTCCHWKVDGSLDNDKILREEWCNWTSLCKWNYVGTWHREYLIEE